MVRSSASSFALWLALAVGLALTGGAVAGVGFIQAKNVGAPTFFGLGDIVPGALIYYSVDSCYSNATTGTIAIVEATAGSGTVISANSPSSTLGCSNGKVSVTSGSPLSTTCSGVCDTFRGFDQSNALSCTNAASAPANCILEYMQTAAVSDRVHRPEVRTTIAPNATLCEHYLGWNNGVPPNAQTLNNQTATLPSTGAVPYPTSGFGPISEPYTVAVLFSSDGEQVAGTSGGPNNRNNPQDSNIKVGFQTTGTTPPIAPLVLVADPVVGAGHPIVGTPKINLIIGQLYSVLGIFNESGVGNGGAPNSQLCVNGSCTHVWLSGTVGVAATPTPWTGFSIGNGTGGWGGNFCEVAMWNGDKSTQAFAIWMNQQARFGGF